MGRKYISVMQLQKGSLLTELRPYNTRLCWGYCGVFFCDFGFALKGGAGFSPQKAR
jgi:hypothetical protein